MKFVLTLSVKLNTFL